MNKMIQRITFLTIGISFVIMLLSALIVKDITTIIASVAFGTITSLFSFFLIVVSTSKLARNRSIMFYFLRFILNGIAIALGFKLNLIVGLVILGLFTHKIAIIIYGFYFKEV